ncbi:D-alanyl-D-alanine carboxypeptidase family protein [Streptomyces sp. NBC_01716]|uniref:D-alanyl-D-alanine carboxypeptidase family protein n=1 Tax=Streptomyces sp. NBC_01716 TaxID=2975917 RepID=UPI002E37DD4F|nr:D-alanyl-D-alanine carboxypeptidase [Streptomyces sp. NBC_01716]
MSALRKTALTVLAAALLPVLTAAPVLADDANDANTEKSEDKQPKPPAAMSTVGGTLLGKPGTQVNLAPGVPVLPKKLTGRSWIVADAESGDVLASHNAHWRLPPASTLKMLFADTVLPVLPKTESHKVTPEDLAGIGEGSSLVGVKENSTYTVHDLWMGVFLRSGNDAVHVLSQMNGGVGKTVADMNKHAAELKALDTNVVSPDGYDEKGQVSSAYDLTLIARSGLQKKDFREYSSTVRVQFPGEEKKPKKGKKAPKRETFEIQNTNRLLTGDSGLDPYKGIAGVKNGNTTNAGSTFTGVAERDGRVLLVTVMNPSEEEGLAVYQETARLLDWGFTAAGKVEPIGELVKPGTADGGSDKEAVGDDSGDKSEAGGSGGTDQAGLGDKASASGSSGMGIAVAIAGGALLLLAAAVFLVNRRWPLPDLVKRLPGR